MKKFYLLLLTACLFTINLFANDSVTVAEKINTKPFDAVGPVISYTLVTKSSCLVNKAFTATITDADGVNTTVGTRPRLYYRRSTDNNAWVDNTSATNGWKYVEATNTSSPFTFTFNYTLLFGGTGISSGQTVNYFVVAQDLIPNVSINTGTFSTAPSSVALTSTAFPVNLTNSYLVVNDLSIVQPLTIGAAGDFNTLSASGSLFSAINNVGISQNTTVEIIDASVTETNSVALSQVQNTGCTLATVSLLIKPASGISPILSGNIANKPIITILSNNVTIDGSNNGTTSRNLTLTNGGTGGNVIILGSSGTTSINNTTLKNTICINSSSTTSAGCIVVADVGTGSTGYFNNITIQNNSVQKTVIGLNCSAVGNTGNGSILITGNDLNTTGTNQIGGLGIYLEGMDGAVVTNNNIGNFESALAAPRYGMQVFTNTKNATISGNNISGINYTGTGTSPSYGIYVLTGLAASNVNITNNIITGISSSGTTVSSAVHGITIASSATSGVTIQKNKISNIKQSNTSGYGAYGISSLSTATSGNSTIANNFIFDVAGYGSSTLPASRNGQGIYLGAGVGYKIYYNSVNLNTAQLNPAAVGISAALMINGVTTASSLDIRNNILANTQTSGVPIASRYGIYSANPNTIFSNIDNNDYYAAGTNIGFLGSNCATITAMQTNFGGNTNSINSLPDFVSATDLHLNPSSFNCPIDNKGTFIAAITDDIDVQTRSTTTPDPGADEFSAASTTLAGIAGAPTCDNETVTVAGTLYKSSCNSIAKIAATGADPVSGTINACVTLDATQQYFNGQPYVKRHYDLEPAVSNQTSTSATVTLYFTDAEFLNYNGVNPVWPPLPTVANGGNIDPNRANVRLTQFHGAATVTPSTPGNYPGTRLLIIPTTVFYNGNYWEVTFPVTGFSGFYLHSTIYNTPLPIDINFLTGRKQGSDHLLNWKVTCNTTPRATMVLQRSGDSRNFNDLYSITADALRCNQPFDYTDVNPLPGMNYYRLKIIDADGKITYSTTVALLNATKGFDIISLAPNPVVNDNFNLNVSSAQAGKMEVVIFDMQGRIMQRETLQLIAGFSSLPVNVAKLAKGTYTIKAFMRNDQPKVMRFVKQ